MDGLALYRTTMADPRIIDITLDEHSIGWRSADVEQERRIAIFDLLEGNHFAPQRVHADGSATVAHYNGTGTRTYSTARVKAPRYLYVGVRAPR